MFFKGLLLSVFFGFSLFVTVAQAAHFTGSLQYDDGLVGAPAWDSARLTWTVDDETNPGLWTYQYSIAVGAKAISSVIIGVAKSFASQNMKEGTTPGFELGTFGQQGASTPGIPGEMYEVKWDISGNALNYSWRIVTDRAPMWGDFYAKDGKDNKKGKENPRWVFAHNLGFGSQHFDSPVEDGNSGGFVLVPGMAFHEKKVALSAVNAFKKIRAVVDPRDETSLKVTFVGNHIEISSTHWTYVLDRGGYQVFRPVALHPYLKATFAIDIGPILTRWLMQPVPEGLVAQARQVVQLTFGEDPLVGMAMKAMPTRELITSKKADSETVRFHEGRTMVLFTREKPDASMVRSYRTSMSYAADGHPIIKVESADTPSRSYEAAITFAPGGSLIRVESSIQAAEVREAARTLNEGLSSGSILSGMLAYDPALWFGSFFDPDEKRFELNSYSYEGEKFLQPANWPCFAEECDNYEDEKCRDCNPFYPCFPDPEVWWCVDAMYPTTDEYRNRSDYRDHYRYWSWYWWFIYGQKNGIRGNWNEITQSWEYGVKVNPSQNLESYDFTGWIGSLHDGLSCNDEPFSYRKVTDKKLNAAFYKDLESNHVALINTHGGPIHDVYQLRRGMDVWFKLHEEGDAGLGKGKLRHLFLETCSGMNWNNNVFWQPQNLFTDWMNWHVADGIRMALGYDGSRIGHFWNGWLFFGYYHGGDSISQAWFNQALVTHPCNVPIVVAYGATEDEAATTLLDGRFTKSRAGTGWIIASELLTHELLNVPRPCCMPGGSCVAELRFKCLDLGGRPHECGKSCGDSDVACPTP